MTNNGNIDLAPLEDILTNTPPGSRTHLLPVLHATQRVYDGYLPEPVLVRIGQHLRTPLADVHGVVEFYTMFYNKPVGEQVIRICTDPACALAGGEEALIAACHQAGDIHPGETSADGTVTVERMTCLGLCDQAPAALVNDDRPYSRITADEVPALFEGAAPPTELLVSGEPRIVTRNVGELAPTDFETHQAAGTFAALEKALTEMTPDEVIDEMKASGIVGRGGAAFPTGLKWQFTRGAIGGPKYVVCNADESEPGTFKDRVLMEGDPFRLLVGIALCGYAIGSEMGYLFVRGEYPLAKDALQTGIDAMRENGLLGKNIHGTDFSFDIEIRRGAGAYICGEETALFEAIEGKRGFPRVKPPFPTTHGLFMKPTAINNVETLATAPDIILNGGEWFTQWGTEKSSGVKLFCVSGHVGKPGIVEAPFGTTIREVIENYAGGFTGTPQAILMGGAAGGFITPENFDARLTFEDMNELQAPVGSGVLMAFDETVDLREVLRNLAHFFAHESCGKCYPCQIGTQRQLEILHRVEAGEHAASDIIALEDIGVTMTDASICGLGQTAASAVMSAMRLWPAMFEEAESVS